MNGKVTLRHPLDVALGARIKAARLAAKPRVTLAWIARETNVTTQQLQKYEAGENRVNFSRLCEIASAMGINVIDLIGPVVQGIKDHPPATAWRPSKRNPATEQ